MQGELYNLFVVIQSLERNKTANLCIIYVGNTRGAFYAMRKQYKVYPGTFCGQSLCQILFMISVYMHIYESPT